MKKSILYFRVLWRKNKDDSNFPAPARKQNKSVKGGSLTEKGVFPYTALYGNSIVELFTDEDKNKKFGSCSKCAFGRTQRSGAESEGITPGERFSIGEP